MFECLNTQELPCVLAVCVERDGFTQSFHRTRIFELSVRFPQIEIGPSVWLQGNRFLERDCRLDRPLQLQIGRSQPKCKGKTRLKLLAGSFQLLLKPRAPSRFRSAAGQAATAVADLSRPGERAADGFFSLGRLLEPEVRVGERQQSCGSSVCPGSVFVAFNCSNFLKAAVALARSPSFW